MSDGRTYQDHATVHDQIDLGDGADRVQMTPANGGLSLDKALQIVGAFGAGSVTIAGDATLDGSIYSAFVDSTAGVRLANLPLGANVPTGRSYLVQKTDASGNTVTVTPQGGNLINGAANLALSTQLETALLTWDGTEWKAVTISAGGGGGGGDLAATLLLGNITGGRDIVQTTGDIMKGTDAAGASGLDGSPVIIAGGAGDGAGGVGPIQGRLAGNARGAGAVDLQQVAGAVAQVAAHPFSALVGGRNNEIALGGAGPTEARGAAIVGGQYNTIDPGAQGRSYSVFMGGGNGNNVGGYSYGSAVFGSYNNIVTAGGLFTSNCLVAGYGNTVNGLGVIGTYNAVALGSGHNNRAGDSITLGRQCTTENYTSLAGGNSSITRGYASFIWGFNCSSHVRSDHSQAFGSRAYAYCEGQSSFSGIPSNQWIEGSGQRAFYTLARETTSNAATELSTDAAAVGATNRLFIRPGRSYAVKILVSARQVAGAAGTLGDTAMWEIAGCIKRDLLGNTSLVGAPTGTGAPLFNDAGAAAWTVAVTADDANETLAITVTGELSKTIRWTAHIYDAESGRNT